MEKTVTSIRHLKPGGLILIDDVPCKIDKLLSSTTGKHGHAKVRVEAIGLFDGIRKNIVKPSHDNVDVPIINKKTAQILAITGDKVQLMDMTDFSVFDLPIPEEMKGTLTAGAEIPYYEVADVKTIKQLK